MKRRQTTLAHKFFNKQLLLHFFFCLSCIKKKKVTVLNYQRQNREKMKLKTEINVRALLPCMEFRAAATQRRKKRQNDASKE